MMIFTKIRKGIFTVLLSGVALYGANAQAVGDYRSNGTGNWGTAGTWQRLNALPNTWAVATGAQGYPGENAVPGTVTIRNGNTVTQNVTTIANNIGSLLVENGGTLTIGNNNTARTLNVNGNITVNTGGVFQARTTAGGTHALNIGGNLTNNGTVNFTAGSFVNTVFTNANAATKTISGSGATFVFNNITLEAGNNPSTLISTVSISANGVTVGAPSGANEDKLLRIDGGTLTCASLTLSNTTNNNRDTNAEVNSGGRLIVNGDITTDVDTRSAITLNGTGWLDIQGTYTTGTFNVSATSTVRWFGNNVNFRNVTAIATGYGNLIIEKPNAATDITKTMTDAVIVRGDFTAQSLHATNTVSFNPAGQSFTVNGTTNLNARGNFIDDNNGGTNTFAGAVTIAANASLSSGNNSPFAFQGDITNNGTLSLTGGTSTATLSGNAIIAGSAATTATFNSLVIASGTRTFGNNANARTINTTNDFTINGGATFQSGNTAGQSHAINLAGNLINDGTLDLRANSATNQVLIFVNNTAARSITGSGTFTLHNLTLQKAGGTPNVTVDATSDITINGVLNFASNSLLIVGTNTNIILGATATIPIVANDRYIQLDGTTGANSNLIRVSDGTAGTWQFTFPIGTATGGYTPLSLTAATIATAPANNSTLSVKVLYGSDAPGNLRRSFRLSVADNPNATTFTNGSFSYNTATDLSTGNVIGDYNTMWFSDATSGSWASVAGIAPGAGSFIGPSTAQTLSNSTFYYKIGTSNLYRTWYSYQSGNWNASSTWTLDGSVYPLYVNPSNEIPNITDNVVITSARTVTMINNNVQVNSLDVTGILDLAATTGHNFVAISGPGRIKMGGTTDNFPLGNATSFADPLIGGTLEINGTDISLNQPRTFNHVEINMTGGANIATLMNNYTINGNLTITNGIFRFNDNAAAVSRTCRVNGNVVVEAAGGIRTGTANSRHEFNLYGDFTNDGTAYFTQRMGAVTAAVVNGVEANNGIVDVNLVSAVKNQVVSCNGVTRFYRIEISKGVDETYKATLLASAVANFTLYGKADYDIDEANAAANANGANLNALGLNVGAVEIGANVVIPFLNTVTNYAIYEGAQLWVNGGSVTKPTGTAIVPYGRLKVSAGSLVANVGSGITTRDNGIIEVSGGTLTALQIRTSVVGVGAVGSYIQSGGAVILQGGAVDANYAVFSLTYPGNVFNMSGGTLTIQNRDGLGVGNLRGAIFINSDPTNISVTGGTVIMEADNAIVYRITSRAAFWNVIMRATGGVGRPFQLLGTTSGTGGGANEPAVPIQPLTVLGNFTIENLANFTTNNADVSVSGNFAINNGGTYVYGTNTTTLTGAGVSSLIFGNTGVTQAFNNLTINKTNPSDEVVITAGRAGPANAALQVNGILTVSKGIFDYGAFVVSAQGAVNLSASAVIGKSASTGRLLLNGGALQTINSSLASIHNLDVNNAAGVRLETNNLTILKALTLTTGVFNIQTFKLTLNGAAALITPATFGTNRMIQTAGNASDGGLEMYVDANETIVYPLGVPGKYTPATAAFQSFNDDGLVRIVPVNGILQTVNLGGGPAILNFYWRTSHLNFSVLPRVSFQFVYVDGDILNNPAAEASYQPGKVLDVSPFTRSVDGATNDVLTGSNTIVFNGTTTGGAFPGVGFTLEQANYTAGEANRFNGSPEVYYSRGFGDGATRPWTDVNNWTMGAGAFGVHDSRQAPATDYPQAGDIAIVGFVPFGDPAGNNGSPHGVRIEGNVSIAELRFNQMLDISNNPTARVYAYNFQFRPTVCINNPGTQGQLLGAKVSGEGMFWIRSTGGNLSDPTFAGVDLGAFNLQDSSYMVYESTVNNAVYNNAPSAYPNLLMATDGWGTADRASTIPKNITVNGDLELMGNVNLALNTGATGDITVNRNLRIFSYNGGPGPSSGGGGELRFGNTGTPRTVTVGGNLIIGNSSDAIVRILTPGTTPLTHTFNLYGNFIQNTTAGNGFKAGTSTTNDRIHMNLLGPNSMTLSNAAGDVPQFYSLTVNKGLSIATTATFNSNFTINGPTNQAVKSLVLQNGLFIINNASANVELTSGGGNFSIPGSAGLEVRAGTARTTTTATNANLILDGLLRVSGGTVDINGGGATDTNYIEYSNSGNSVIEVTGGNLTVAGKIRRALTSLTGVLRYTQSAGTVLIANESGAGSNDRGVFEVVNPGSQFNHSGGDFTLVQGINSTTVPSLWLEPASSTITGGSTITIGNTSTPINSVNIGIRSTAILNNVMLAGSNNPVAKIYITPLTVNGNLTISAGTTLNANSQNLTIGGNFTVNGSYVPTTNVTTFSNAGAALISGATPLLQFYDFVKTGAGITTVSKDITINQDLRVLAGTLASSTFTTNLKRHAQINGTLTNTTGSGLIFNGAVQQQLTRSASGTGTLGIVTVNNSLGVIIPDGNGYNFDITTGLRLQQGIFDIGGSLLFLRTNATITPVSPFSITNMIQTNSSFTDKGVKKEFPTNYTTDFTFPVGQLAYTPVVLNLSSPGFTTGAGGTPTFTVRPANERHPSVIDDNQAGELPSPAAFVDMNNVLQYHWIVNADNVQNTFRSAMTLSYPQSVVSFTAPYTEADYLAARILKDANPTKLINKFTTAEVDETTNIITFNFVGVTDAGISADYFAGVDIAIPNNLPVYTTVASGNVDAAVYTPAVPGGGAPTGAAVVVSPGHNLTFNLNGISLYEIQISAGATVTLPSGSTGHRLGSVTGTGDLRIDSDITSASLPAAVYDDFFSCAGGGLIYGGTGSYEIMGGVTTVRSLTLVGSGTKTLGNNDVTICNDLIVNGVSFNTNGRTVTVQNDFNFIAGTYNFGLSVGALNVTRDLNSAGAFNGGAAGLKTVGRNLSVTAGTFTPGLGATNIFRVNGNMTVAGAATIVSGLGNQRFMFGGSSVQTLTGLFTGTRAFNRLEINNAAGLTLAGNTTIDTELLLTSGKITPGANIFLLGANAISTPTEGSATSFVNGRLYKVFANTGDSFVFPIGGVSTNGLTNFWRSGAVKNVSAAGTWDMEFSGANADVAEVTVTNMTPVAPIVRISTGGYWVVTDGSATPSGKTATIGLSWGIESDVSAIDAQRQQLCVVQWETTSWANKGGTNFSAGHTQSRGTFDASSTTSFSRRIVTLGSLVAANPLPVSFLAFNGRTENGINILQWSTATEKNNDYFEIERSIDNGESFDVIGKLPGNGTSQARLSYAFEDHEAQLGKNYYRLKQVDFDGKISYHPDLVLLTLESKGDFLDFDAFPNPTQDQLVNLKVFKANSEPVRFRFFDVNGKICLELNEESPNLQIPTGHLSRGVYIIEASQGYRRVTKRLVIN